MTTAQPPASRFLTGWSVAGLVLLLPTVVLAWLVVLAGERGSRCLTYGEQCSTIPGGLLHGLFYASLAAGVAALAWPRPWRCPPGPGPCWCSGPLSSRWAP
ncbi:hypothetical protein OG604_29290 [Streptomyces sp. NBC_01231]|nr:hypothetical protein OG604_29290 [Streptomyces sp. NBC_01231]